ncbi:hypothetical protein ACLB2K_061550 [Fragaria x ananassa]
MEYSFKNPENTVSVVRCISESSTTAVSASKFSAFWVQTLAFWVKSLSLFHFGLQKSPDFPASGCYVNCSQNGVKILLL